MREDETGSLEASTYQPEDEHVQLMIQKTVKLCQDSEKILINELNKKADRAHGRVDDLEDRMLRMDDPKVGMVTKLVENSDAVSKYIRNGIIAILLAMIASFLAQQYSSANNLKQIVKETIKESMQH
jgi:hypothetical protein